LQPRHSVSSKSQARPGVAGPSSILGVPVVDLAIALGLILAVFAVYAQVGAFDFINWDDPAYVYDNPHVKAGLAPDSIRWAMTAVVVANWMPVTLFSHMLDCQLFHTAAGMHHLMSVLLHLLATLLLFAVLKRAAGARWPSAFAAFIFAVHPLHVESVAWIAERKDVLSTCFLFLALYLYLLYVERPTVRAYSLVALVYALGLMAKPMLVTFPFMLLLFDFWPLHRAPVPSPAWKKLFGEKLPLIALSAAASSVTYAVQSTRAAMPYPMPMRIANALVSYAVYIEQTFWPARLSVLYIYREAPAMWQTVAAAILLVAVSAGVIVVRRTRPYLAVGWFWFLGTLVPVIGLVQVGVQSHADRYMYIPMVGLLIMLGWAARDFVAGVKWPRAGTVVALTAVIAGIAYASAAHAQVEYWQNSGTLFSRAVEVTEGNFIAELNLGNYLMNSGRGLEAIAHFEAALRLDPQYGQAENNIGMVLANVPGRMPEAISHFEAALRLKPDLPEAHFNLASMLAQIPGRESEAIAHFEAVQRLEPRPDIPALIAQLRARH
jgi:tetratricopeptide (TPR) repeat protein